MYYQRLNKSIHYILLTVLYTLYFDLCFIYLLRLMLVRYLSYVMDLSYILISPVNCANTKE